MIKLLLTIILCSSAAFLSAQSMEKAVTASAGRTMAVSEISIDFTIGEPIVGLISNESSIDQGFWAGSLQVEHITEQKDLGGIVVYPNPVINELTIFTDQMELFGITLFGLDGRRVLKHPVERNQLEHTLDLSYLSKGVYVLRLYMNDEGEEKLFKIIKK